MAVRTLQTSYTSGELDPRLANRSDVRHYYNGAEKMRNVFVVPQGGWRRRPGTRFKFAHPNQLEQVDLSGATVTAPNGGTAGNAYDDDVSTEVVSTTNISTTNPYVLLHVDLGVATNIQFADVVGLRLTAGTSGGEWAIQYSTDNAAWTTLGNAIDTLDTGDKTRRATGPVSARYWRVARIGATDLSTAKAALDEFAMWMDSGTVSAVVYAEFEFSTDQRYLMALTDRNMRVTRAGAFVVDVPTPFTSGDLRARNDDGDNASVSFTQDLDTLLVFHPDYETRKFLRQGAHDEWQPDVWGYKNLPTFDYGTYDTSGISLTLGAVTGSGITATAGSAIFSSGMVGYGVRSRDGAGYGKIVGYTSTTVVSIDISTDFEGTTPSEWALEEPVWSDSHGWPISGVFFQNMLWLGGSKGRPDTYWKSRSFDPRDFDTSSTEDDYAFEGTLGGGSVAAIWQIVAGRHLWLFTQSKEFYVPKSDTEGMTPTNITARSTTSRGIRRGTRAYEVDGAGLFIQRKGKALREFIYTDTEAAYQANNVSLLSSHLLTDPVDMALRRSTSTEDADYLLIVNDDGTLAVFCTLRSQQVNAFTLSLTDGKFVAVGVDLDEMYVGVERTIDGATVRYHEQFDFELFLDAAVDASDLGAPVSGLSNLDHLEGETVDIVLDGAVQPQQVVSGGSVTFAREAENSYQVGLRFPDVGNEAGDGLWVKDMPIEPNLPDGTAVGRKKRIVWVTARLFQSKGLKINGVRISFQTTVDAFEPPAAFTGDKREDGLLGWDDYGQVEFSENLPVPVFCLGASKGIAI